MADNNQTSTQSPVNEEETTQSAEEEAKTRESVGRSSAMMSGLIIVSRITGFFRTWAQAYAVGVTMLASCYTIANNLPNLLYELVMGGMLVTAFLPVYMSVKHRLGRKGANAYASNLFSFTLLIMGGLSLASVIFAAPIVWTQLFSATNVDFDLSVYFFRFFAIEIMLYSLSMVVSGILNAEREYFWSTAAPIFNNFVTIASFVLYIVFEMSNPGLALVILGLGNPLGVLVQLLVQLPALHKQGVRLTFHIDWHDPEIKETLSIGIPSFICTIVMFVTTSFETSYEMQSSVSGSSIAYYARIWYTLPYSILAVPLTTALFTEISDLFAKYDIKGYRRSVSKGISQILFMLIPMMLFLIVFSQPLITVMSGRSFSLDEINLTAEFLCVLAVSLPVYGVYIFLQKIFSSMRHMNLFAGASVIAGAVCAVFMAVCTPMYGLMIPAWSNTIFYVIVDGIGVAQLWHNLGGLGIRHIIAESLRSLVLGLAGALVGFLILTALNTFVAPCTTSMGRAFLYCLVGGIPALIVTYGGAVALKMPEAGIIRRVCARFIPALRK